MALPQRRRASLTVVFLGFAYSLIAVFLLVGYRLIDEGASLLSGNVTVSHPGERNASGGAGVSGSSLGGNVTVSEPGEWNASGGAGFSGSSLGSPGGGGARIFIAVKTTSHGIYQQRMAAVRRTWLRDALEERDVDINFFVGKSAPSSAAERAASNDTMEVGGMADEEMDGILESLVVPLQACSDRRLVCKTFGAMRYFLEHELQSDDPPAFYCNFDDDTYVIVPNLLRALSAYQREPPWYGRNLYIGQQTWKKGYSQHGKNGTIKIHFHTGGAYCISSDVFRRGGEYLKALELGGGLPSLTLPDDIAVGYWVQEEAGVTPVVDDSRFHSHWEDQKRVPRDQIANQVAFAYNSKNGPGGAKKFANVPRIFPQEEDPLLFRSLRCFILGENRKNNDTKADVKYKAECHNASI